MVEMREKNLARFPNNRTLNCPCSFLNLFPFKIAVCVFRDSMKVDELCGNCSKDLTHNYDNLVQKSDAQESAVFVLSILYAF